MERDRELEEFNKNTWYSVKLDTLESSEIKYKFVQLGLDPDTEAFIDQSVLQSDFNGMLSRGSMFVFSKSQFVKLTNLTEEEKFGSMLDLGAGDGRPTEAMSDFYQQVFATEVSSPMRKHLALKGFEVLDIDKWKKASGYDLISALNLFDRGDKPLNIISDIHHSLTPNGLFVVALVLPFRPYVESVPSHKPSQLMNITGEQFEDQVATAVKMFEDSGFLLKSWSRVPYLCEGDLNRPLYQLNNALLVFTKN